MDPRNLLPRHRKHPERVVVPQIVLRSERKPRQIAKLSAILRMCPGRVERVPVMRYILVSMP